MRLRIVPTVLASATLVAALLTAPTPVSAADHRDAPAANSANEGDLTDVYAFVDPGNRQRVILIMGVNGFATPAALNSYKFSPEFLYQFKIDLNNDAREDKVIQVKFEGSNATTQRYKVYIATTDANTTGVINMQVTSSDALYAEGLVNQVNGRPDEVQAFAGIREDPFVFDLGQFNRILGGTQDVFRNLPTTAVGPLRGRPVRADGTSGFDAFNGFNATYIALSLPVSVLAPTGNRIGVWATVSAPFGAGSYVQFERMGQPAFNTVFTPTAFKDLFNASSPADDMANFGRFVPDALTTTDTDTSGNTIAGRAQLLTTLGLTSAPAGAPLLLPGTFANTNRNLLRVALLPDVLRLDLSLAWNDLALGQFGLINGRRPNDDGIDIALLLLRQLADVNFPAALGVPGSGPARPGALNFGTDRRVLVVLQGSDFIKPDNQLNDVSTSGNDRSTPSPFVFPFLGEPHPLPGDAGTVGPAAQQ